MQKTTNPKKRFKFKLWMILPLLLLVFIGLTIAWYTVEMPLLYAYKLKYIDNPFKKGDKMYLYHNAVNQTSSKHNTIELYRFARPLNDDEVDAMNISLAEKALIKKDLSSKKPIMADCGWVILTDSLCKYKTAFIGNYSASKVSAKYFGEDFYYPTVYLAVHPPNRILSKPSNTQAPSGYVFDDKEPFYLSFLEIDVTDSKNFREL